MRKASDRPTATVHEVARVAGVSAATVSRLLNGTAKVSDDKRQAIEEAIERLNYKPNVLAQNLKTGSSRTIGILTQSLASGYFADAMAGVDEALQGTGYAPLIVSGHWHADEEAERIELLIARRVDGLVILSGNLKDAQILALSEQVPIVAFGRDLQGPRTFGFCLDNYRGACDAVEHLVAHGHRDIAFIAGPFDHRDALARRQFQIAHGDPPVSEGKSDCAAWSSRRLTTAGVAPMSLMQMRVSLSFQRSWKSAMTACQVAPKPTAAVRTSISQAPFSCAGSIRTSRFPEPTTPTSCAAPPRDREPCSNRN